MPNEIFTIGYEKRSVEEVLAILRMAEIGILTDVRTNAYSRKAGFSLGELDPVMRRNGILYRHYGGLGADRQHRDDLEKTGDYEAFFRAYKGSLFGKKKTSVAVLQAILDGIDGRKVAIMCYEADPLKCHRSALAEFMQGADPELQIIHLPTQETTDAKRD